MSKKFECSSNQLASYLTKFLDISAKSFFPCANIFVVYNFVRNGCIIE